MCLACALLSQLSQPGLWLPCGNISLLAQMSNKKHTLQQIQPSGSIDGLDFNSAKTKHWLVKLQLTEFECSRFCLSPLTIIHLHLECIEIYITESGANCAIDTLHMSMYISVTYYRLGSSGHYGTHEVTILTVKLIWKCTITTTLPFKFRVKMTTRLRNSNHVLANTRWSVT